MCTATYIPRLNGGFVLTHSRDEKTARPAAQLPQSYDYKNRDLIYPKDPKGGGTWIVTSPYLTVCLLNGAFTAHQPQPPYKHSRGLVPLHVFNYTSIHEFLNKYNPTGLEPFTLLLAEIAGPSGGRLTELRWTGHQMHVSAKDPKQPHIWSSATLYSPDIVQQREGWFQTWLRHNPETSVEAIRWFHHNGGQGDDQNAIRMSRPDGLMTLSLTSVLHLGGIPPDETVEMRYEDFTSNQSVHHTLNAFDYATA